MSNLEQIHSRLKSSKAIIILTGAGMGIDSGLADYRGNGGQWGKVEDDTELNAVDVVNPKYFSENPKYVWKMFAQRMIEYEKTKPHAGFDILKKWINDFKLDSFIITSNIDEHFVKSGFNPEKHRELHGNIFYMQCNKPCKKNIWRYDFNLEKLMQDLENDIFPKCSDCGNLVRPNVYMFRDYSYISTRSDEAEKRFKDFLNKHKTEEIIIFEIGSGPHVQSIRKKTRMLGLNYNALIVRINPKDFKIKEPHIGIDKGALEALKEIDDFICS